MSTSIKKNSTSQTLQNLYTHRTATSERPCFVCGKFTSAVLTTGNGLDWFYTCVSHLNDRGFASPVPLVEPEPVKITEPTSKGEKEKENEKKKEGKDEQKFEDSKEEKCEEKGGKEVKPPSLSIKPKQYTLHRDFFYLRESNLKKKRQEKEAQEMLKQLPSVPKSSLK
ncbi:14372_t:CDS:2 [Acaulospora morrowiae]|uniref:14372_t:CDS:1 n=1 Tax=Acaulospora morrowiae TaxID=94023 RepID=A0A9N9BVV7_9GLOM|nr:14372_t:CDS:2 [Acaulospora morrowiae]